jgi:hypothetical protein
MLDEEFPIPMDNDVTRIAAIAVLVGSIFIRYSSWVTVGWAVVVFGFVALWLAHQIAIAPECDEPVKWLGLA